MQADKFWALAMDANDTPPGGDKTEAICKAREFFVRYAIGTHSCAEQFSPYAPNKLVSFYFQDGSYEVLNAEVWTVIRGW